MSRRWRWLFWRSRACLRSLRVVKSRLRESGVMGPTEDRGRGHHGQLVDVGHVGAVRVRLIEFYTRGGLYTVLARLGHGKILGQGI